MSCPNEIADVLLQILARGVVQARSAGWSEKLEQATLEADHVHNLPDLVRQYDPEKLAYYWKHERLSYISRFEHMNGAEPTGFTELWARLEILMPGVITSLPEKSASWESMQRLIQESAAEFGSRRSGTERI